MAKSTNYRGIHISVTYAMGYDYYEISQINKGKKWNDKTLFATLKEAKMYIDEHYDELIKNESKKSARKSIKESDYIFQFDEFLSLMKKEDITVKIAKNGYVFFADDETLGNNLLGFINPNTSNQKLHIKVPMSTVATLDEFENTKELVDFIISEYSHNKRKFESKKSARKSIKESMNLDYGDFDYKKFENWIIRYLEDYGCEVNTVEIICDDYGYDVEINVENGENLPSRISDKDYGAFIFDAMYTTNCLYLKMPIVRAMKIAEEFSPKVLKVNDDSILIGDKNSDTEIWLDVWTDNDGDEDYTEWDYNQQSFNLNNYEDMVQKYLQQIDDFFYILDGEVSDNFPLTESKKLARKSLKEMFDDEGIVDDFVDFLIYDCGYDKKTVEKYFYKKYKLNGLDVIPTKLYIKIKNEIEDALGYNDIM